MMSGVSFFRFVLVFLVFSGTFQRVTAHVDENQPGAWYMYFFNTTFGDGPWGVQGDIQYRNWNVVGDLEQLLLRGGVTFEPEDANIKWTLGYGYIATGEFGESDRTSGEHRIYQEVLYPVRIGQRFLLTHRLRYEQRFVEAQDIRTRYRYNLFLNVPLNRAEMTRKTVYLAFYNEIFINGQRSIGQGKTVGWFDRNRFYVALGYVIRDGMNIQVGLMNQTTEQLAKNQFQLSVHHRI